MNSSTLIQNRRGPALVLAIHRPEDANRINMEALRAIESALDEIHADPEIRAVVITGSPEHFCSGGRIDGHPGGTVEQQLRFAQAFCSLQARMAQTSVPIVAAVEGPCTAGGMSILAACDLAIAAEGVHFSFPEINFGLFPVLAMAVAHPMLAPKKAMELFYTGRNIDAQEALQLNLINAVVPAASLWEEVDRMVAMLASKSSTALHLGRKAYYAMAPMVPAARLEYAQTALTSMLAAAGTSGAVPTLK